jgi:TP901 family phage tail tape measure protein
MGNVGLKGSMAGTGIQSFFTRLLAPIGRGEASMSSAPSDYAESMFKSFVNDTTTKEGKFKPTVDITAELNDVMEALNDQEQAWFAYKLFGLFQMKSGFTLAKNGGHQLQGVIDDITNNSPGTNDKKWDLMLDTSYGKQAALGNAMYGIKTDVGYRLSPITNEIADQLFQVLANKGNYI